MVVDQQSPLGVSGKQRFSRKDGLQGRISSHLQADAAVLQDETAFHKEAVAAADVQLEMTIDEETDIGPGRQVDGGVTDAADAVLSGIEFKDKVAAQAESHAGKIGTGIKGQFNLGGNAPTVDEQRPCGAQVQNRLPGHPGFQLGVGSDQQSPGVESHIENTVQKKSGTEARLQAE